MILSTPYCALSITPIGVADAAPISYELIGDSTEIGSADDNAIVLADPSVAPHHLAVRRADDRVHLLVDVTERWKARDRGWLEFQPGDVYWCPRHGRIERLDRRGRCPECQKRRGSLWLLRPLQPGDGFDIGSAFHATLVARSEPDRHAMVEPSVFPPSDLFRAETRSRVAVPAIAPEIPIAAPPLDDSNMWRWQPIGVSLSVFLHQRVNRMVAQHARQNDHCEVGGVLLGDVRQDTEGNPFVVVTHALQAEFAAEARGQLTFTSKTWLKIHQAHEAQYPDKTIVGWYHTHPGWTVFLSEWDLFIHRNFFKEPWQIAMVLDPSLDRAGFFVWQGSQVLSPNSPLAPFRPIELDGWTPQPRPRVRIKLL